MGARRSSRTPERNDALAVRETKPPVKLPKTLRALVAKQRRDQSYVSFCIGRLPGGRRLVYELLPLFPQEPDAVEILKAWRDKGGLMRAGSMEEILEAATVAPSDFMQLVTRMLVEIGMPTAHMIAAAAYPDIMDASVRRALDVEKGGSEREMHFKHTGFVPAAKGIQIGIKNTNGGGDPDHPAGPGEAQSFDRTARTVVRQLPGD